MAPILVAEQVVQGNTAWAALKGIIFFLWRNRSLKRSALACRLTYSSFCLPLDFVSFRSRCPTTMRIHLGLRLAKYLYTNFIPSQSPFFLPKCVSMQMFLGSYVM